MRDEFCHTADVQYSNHMGLFVYACYFGRDTSHNNGIPNGGPDTENAPLAAPAVVKDTYESTVDVQAAYAINKQIEPFVRGEYLHLQRQPPLEAITVSRPTPWAATTTSTTAASCSADRPPISPRAFQ